MTMGKTEARFDADEDTVIVTVSLMKNWTSSASVSPTSAADLTGSRSSPGEWAEVRGFGDYVAEPPAEPAWSEAAAARSDTKAWFAS
jgi:hypothetical protein